MGLRESKKERTRQELAAAAMRLFAERGFEHVTVAEVAAAVGVSEKTVFNYFPTKEDLFFDEVPEREAALLAAVRDRASGASIVAALRQLQSQECSRLCSPGFATFARIIEESPALQAKEIELMARFTDSLAACIVSELGVAELDAHVAANMLLSVHWQFFRQARDQALRGRQGASAVRRLRADLDRAYHLLECGLTALEPA